MLWLAFAILTAFFESLKDVKSKQSLRYLDEYWVTWAVQLIAALCLLPLLLITGIPPIGPNFWWAWLGGGSLNIVAFLLYIKAIKTTDLSLTVPLVTLTPLFMLITSPVMVGEFPSWLDGVGVLLIVIGSYILNLQADDRGWFAPLRSLLTNPGCRKMLLVALIWSFTSNFDKVGVTNSSPFFWSVALFLFIACGITPILLYRLNSSPPSKLLPHWQLLSLTGALAACAIGFQMVAVTLTTVAQVIAVKRMSSLISVLFGYFLFQEGGLRERLSGAIVMVLGVIVITLF
jgi:drug/metabolite transporter (DMT)-like permease